MCYIYPLNIFSYICTVSGSKEYYIIKKVKDAENIVEIKGKQYQIRFIAKHAEHIWDNYSDKNHNIKHREILSLIKRSILVQKKNNFICIGKYGNKIYETHVIIKRDILDIKTSYLSNKEPYRKTYKEYENKKK